MFYLRPDFAWSLRIPNEKVYEILAKGADASCNIVTIQTKQDWTVFRRSDNFFDTGQIVARRANLKLCLSNLVHSSSDNVKLGTNGRITEHSRIGAHNDQRTGGKSDISQRRLDARSSISPKRKICLAQG